MVPSSVASFLVLGGGGGQDPEMYRQNNICTYIARANEASERLRNIYFHDSKYICIVIYNAVSFNYFLYGAINDIILTKQHYEQSMNMRASGASELRKFFTFSYSKTAISFNILLVLQILCLRNTFIFRSQITSAYIHNIINAFSFYHLWYDASI